jgi:uracil-DNA glycosylase family 4
MPDVRYDAACRRCQRLADFLDRVKERYPTYACRPVAPFGPVRSRLVIVGLAPGMHGANRSGRPFTGDHAGVLLYETLHRHGFASAPVSTAMDDGLRLIDARITNAVKCLPPDNKPDASEVRQCNGYLQAELAGLRPGDAILALGSIAHQAVLMALGLRRSEWTFGHAAVHALAGGITLFDSYHCSRYNTQTRRLTPAMFDAVFAAVRAHLRLP